MPEARGYGAAASAGQSVYLMGGGTGKKWFNSVLRYDVHDEAWFAVRAATSPTGAKSLHTFRSLSCSCNALGNPGNPTMCS